MNRKHKGLKLLAEEEYKIQCNVCLRKYKSEKTLKQHKCPGPQKPVESSSFKEDASEYIEPTYPNQGGNESMQEEGSQSVSEEGGNSDEEYENENSGRPPANNTGLITDTLMHADVEVQVDILLEEYQQQNDCLLQSIQKQEQAIQTEKQVTNSEMGVQTSFGKATVTDTFGGCLAQLEDLTHLHKQFCNSFTSSNQQEEKKPQEESTGVLVEEKGQEEQQLPSRLLQYQLPLFQSLLQLCGKLLQDKLSLLSWKEERMGRDLFIAEVEKTMEKQAEAYMKEEGEVAEYYRKQSDFIKIKNAMYATKKKMQQLTKVEQLLGEQQLALRTAYAIEGHLQKTNKTQYATIKSLEVCVSPTDGGRTHNSFVPEQFAEGFKVLEKVQIYSPYYGQIPLFKRVDGGQSRQQSLNPLSFAFTYSRIMSSSEVNKAIQDHYNREIQIVKEALYKENHKDCEVQPTQTYSQQQQFERLKHNYFNPCSAMVQISETDVDIEAANTQLQKEIENQKGETTEQEHHHQQQQEYQEEVQYQEVQYQEQVQQQEELENVDMKQQENVDMELPKQENVVGVKQENTVGVEQQDNVMGMEQQDDDKLQLLTQTQNEEEDNKKPDQNVQQAVEKDNNNQVEQKEENTEMKKEEEEEVKEHKQVQVLNAMIAPPETDEATLKYFNKWLKDNRPYDKSLSPIGTVIFQNSLVREKGEPVIGKEVGIMSRDPTDFQCIQIIGDTLTNTAVLRYTSEYINNLSRMQGSTNLFCLPVCSHLDGLKYVFTTNERAFANQINALHRTVGPSIQPVQNTRSQDVWKDKHRVVNYVAIPILTNRHFYLLVIDTSTCQVYIYDSYFSKGTQTNISIICKNLKYVPKTYKNGQITSGCQFFREYFEPKIKWIAGPKQNDTVSCGLFVCHMIRYLQQANADINNISEETNFTPNAQQPNDVNVMRQLLAVDLRTPTMDAENQSKLSAKKGLAIWKEWPLYHQAMVQYFNQTQSFAPSFITEAQVINEEEAKLKYEKNKQESDRVRKQVQKACKKVSNLSKPLKEQGYLLLTTNFDTAPTESTRSKYAGTISPGSLQYEQQLKEEDYSMSQGEITQADIHHMVKLFKKPYIDTSLSAQNVYSPIDVWTEYVFSSTGIYNYYIADSADNEEIQNYVYEQAKSMLADGKIPLTASGQYSMKANGSIFLDIGCGFANVLLHTFVETGGNVEVAGFEIHPGVFQQAEAIVEKIYKANAFVKSKENPLVEKLFNPANPYIKKLKILKTNACHKDDANKPYTHLCSLEQVEGIQTPSDQLYHPTHIYSFNARFSEAHLQVQIRRMNKTNYCIFACTQSPQQLRQAGCEPLQDAVLICKHPITMSGSNQKFTLYYYMRIPGLSKKCRRYWLTSIDKQKAAIEAKKLKEQEEEERRKREEREEWLRLMIERHDAQVIDPSQTQGSIHSKQVEPFEQAPQEKGEQTQRENQEEEGLIIEKKEEEKDNKNDQPMPEVGKEQQGSPQQKRLRRMKRNRDMQSQMETASKKDEGAQQRKRDAKMEGKKTINFKTRKGEIKEFPLLKSTKKRQGTIDMFLKKSKLPTLVNFKTITLIG